MSASTVLGVEALLVMHCEKALRMGLVLVSGCQAVADLRLKLVFSLIYLHA
jgi:hypothetical protein